MIEIVHTRAEGTLVHGTAKGDGSGKILGGRGGCGFRFSRNIGAWYLPHSRDRASDSISINQAAERLRVAGFQVEVSIDDGLDGARSFAEAEAERYERAEDRADRYERRADKAAATGEALWKNARERWSRIPFGQPILIGHHSEQRDRNYRDRLHRQEGRAFKEMERGEYWASRADAAEKHQARRENIPTTLRRIDKLEADRRQVLRYMDDARLSEKGRARYEADVAQLDEQIAYWREHVRKAQESGTKVWSKDDFAKGDYVLYHGRWWEVLRVNAKSVTIPWAIIGIGAGARIWSEADVRAGRRGVREDGRLHTDTLPYPDVRGRKTAEEIAVMRAEQAAS